ncbi:MAG TPA: tetratricopeptide repeat protein [bacterium]|nr:tetratricopeptide repeat protein [bacterium]
MTKIKILFLVVLIFINFSRCSKSERQIEKTFSEADQKKIKELNLQLNTIKDKGIVLIELGDIYLRNNQIETAVNYYEQALNNLQNKQPAILKITQILINRRNFASAAELIAQFYEKISDKNYLPIFFKLAEIYTLMNLHFENSILLEKLFELYPDNIDVLYRLIENYLKTQDLQKTRNAIDKLKKYNQQIENGAIDYYNGKLELASNKFNIAEKYFKKIIDTNTTNKYFKGLAFQELGKLYFQRERYETAKLYFEKSNEFLENNSENYYYIGLALKNEFAFMLAADNFIKSIDIDYYNLASRYELAEIYFKNLKLYKQALDQLEVLTNIEPDNPKYLKLKADCAFVLNAFNTAIMSYKKIIELDPVGDYAEDAYFALATLYKNIKNTELALQYFQAGADFFPEKWQFFFNIGLLKEELNQYAEALEYYQKAEALMPDFQPITLNIGNVYFKLERYDEAKAIYEKILKTSNNPDAAYNLSLIHKLQKQKNENR